MTVNIDKMMEAVYEALQQPEKAVDTLQEWMPQVVNEITDLRNQVMLKETEILGLQDEIRELT